MARELGEKQDGGQDGVRAIFLYPLNALIKSQKERLQAWSEPFSGRVRFALYNGDTPNHAKSKWKCEVPDRTTLRNHPPQMLVTNPTMLEYMLVRAEDRPILDASHGRLRWIVIDEAHTYLGSQAAELTLLLRRTMHSFGCAPGSVRIVATSATLGDRSDESSDRLRGFLSELAGVSTEQVSVIFGQRSRPEPPQADIAAKGALDLERWRELAPDELFDVFSSEAQVLKTRSSIVERPQRLGQIAHTLFGETSEHARKRALDLLDLCTRAKSRYGEIFLPLRGHVFHRTLAGVWACASGQCPGRRGSRLDSPDWPFGRIYMAHQDRCDCGSPVFELVQCNSCGAEYLTAEEQALRGGDYLKQPRDLADEDEFQEQLDSPDLALEDDEDDDEEELDGGVRGQPRLICSERHATQLVSVHPDGRLDWDNQTGIPINVRLPDDAALTCGICNSKQSGFQGRNAFRAVRVGAPFVLASTTPTLLDSLPRWPDKDAPRPLDGRRLVTFTDSRQGTARSVVKAQQQAERDYVGSLLYHRLSSLRGAPSSASEIEQAERRLEELKKVAHGNTALQSLVAEQEASLEQKKNPPIGSMSWGQCSTALQSSDDFHRWLKPALSELTFGQLTDQELVNLCLYREFFARPRRAYSLEGNGLVRLHYPKLKNLDPPAILKQRGVSREEWQDLLCVGLDTFVRSGSPAIEIPENVRRWLGYPGRASSLLAPEADKLRPDQRSWPYSHKRFRRNRLVRVIERGLNLHLEDADDARTVDEVLRSMWSALTTSSILRPSENGYRLALSDPDVLSLQVLEHGWLCPVTRRALAATFRRVTPYLPEEPIPQELLSCEPLKFPVLPSPFWQEEHGRALADQWLAGDPEIVRLRELGVWTDINDRIARFGRYYRAAEHSAQLSGADLTARERKFKDGQINLLSCSTTMEMGVDIGGLTAVAMNNVPPHPANFLQRAGRAGRRNEPAALSFTLCKATPHGEAVFRNPLWAFETSLATPRVDLRSAPILQRHVNSMALANYLRCIKSDSVPKLRTGWFYEESGVGHSAPVEQFADWCSDSESWPDDLAAGLEWVVKGSSLEGIAVEELLNRTAGAALGVAYNWRQEIFGLLEQQKALKTQDGKSAPERSIQLRLDRWRGEYLLGHLAGAAFLPGYGFPTGVVPLVTTTRDEVARMKRQPESDRATERQRRAGFPTRGLAVAIRDYAPGTDTVLDGRVYRSSGVTLNWQIPVEVEAAPEIQDLRWLWRCTSCGASGTRLAKPQTCPDCGQAKEERLTVRRLLQPSGFAVDFRSQPHNDITIPQYIPVREPLISMAGAEWMMLPDPGLGRHRTSSTAQLVHFSDGLHGNGYSICLRCGSADSVNGLGERSEALRDHKRLQGGKLDDRERVCPGNEESWAIVDGVRLGGSFLTEIFELQLRHDVNRPVKDRATAYSLAVALRRAFCQYIGIEEGEIGVAVAESLDQHEDSAFSIHLFDTASGGAGYSSQIAGLLPELIRKVREDVLECPRRCDSACQACLLTFETQHQIEHLDRHQALQLLTTDYLDSFSLPDALKAYGAGTRLELEPLTLAIGREWQRARVSEIRTLLAGDGADWEPMAWRVLDQLRRYAVMGIRVVVTVDQRSLSGLKQSQRDELFALLMELNAEFLLIPELSGSIIPVAELAGSSDSGETWMIQWGATEASGSVPGPTWGSGVDGARYVRSPRRPGDLANVAGATKGKLDDLRPGTVPGTTTITVAQELDGPVREFGSSAWKLILERVPALNELLSGPSPLRAVTYSDRYLKSPLTALLLRQLLIGLKGFQGGLVPETTVAVTTAELGGHHPTRPKRWAHDWQDAQDRVDVMRSLLADVQGSSKLTIARRQEIPHARILQLDWPNGSQWSVRLDQGVGYWQVLNQRRDEFPFQAAVDQQLRAFQNPNLAVGAAHPGHPTHLYCVRGNGD